MKKIRVVLDTNVVVFSFFGGNPKRILALITSEKIDLIISSDILIEIKDVLNRGSKKLDENEIWGLIEIFEKKAIYVEPKERFFIIKKDPSDNKFLECAVTGKADYLVSGDEKHVLPLKKFRGISIVSPTEFLEIFTKRY